MAYTNLVSVCFISAEYLALSLRKKKITQNIAIVENQDWKKKGITDQRTWSGFSEVNDPLGKPSRLVNSEKFCKLPTIIWPFEYNCWHFFAQFLTGLYN